MEELPHLQVLVIPVNVEENRLLHVAIRGLVVQFEVEVGELLQTEEVQVSGNENEEQEMQHGRSELLENPVRVLGFETQKEEIAIQVH